MADMTAELVRSLLDYDPSTGQMIWLLPPKQHLNLLGKPAGRMNAGGSGKYYCAIQIDGKKYKRSRLAYLWMMGSFPPECIDHINGDSTDDRWENLRAASRLENARNVARGLNGAGLPMGVRRALSGRFVARISVEKRLLTLGTFDTPSEAEAVYLEARKKYFGEFHGIK